MNLINTCDILLDNKMVLVIPCAYHSIPFWCNHFCSIWFQTVVYSCVLLTLPSFPMSKQIASKPRSTSERSAYTALSRLFRRRQSSPTIAVKAEQPISQFNKLPVEILLNIANYTQHEDLLQLLFTCRAAYWRLMEVFDWRKRYIAEYPIDDRRELAWLRQHVRRLVVSGSSVSPLETSSEWFFAYCRRRTTERNMLRGRCLEHSFTLPQAFTSSIVKTRNIKNSISSSSSSNSNGNNSDAWTVMAADARRTVIYHQVNRRLVVIRADITRSKQLQRDFTSKSLMVKQRQWELTWPIEPQIVSSVAMDDAFLVAECRSADRRESLLCVWSCHSAFVIACPSRVVSLVMMRGCWLLVRIPDSTDSNYAWNRFQVYNLEARQWCSGSIVLRLYQRPNLLDIDSRTAYVHTCFTRGMDQTVQWNLWRFSLYESARCINSGEFPRPTIETPDRRHSSYSGSGSMGSRVSRSNVKAIRYCYSDSYNTNSIVYDIAVYSATPYHVVALQQVNRHHDTKKQKEPVLWQTAIAGSIDLVGTLSTSRMLLIYCQNRVHLLSESDGSIVYTHSLDSIGYIAPVLGNTCAIFYRDGGSHQLYNALTGEKCSPWTTVDGSPIVLYGWRQLSVTHLVAKRGIEPMILDYLPLDKQGKRISTNPYVATYGQAADTSYLLPFRIKNYVSLLSTWQDNNSDGNNS
ncbi:hypothetical protein BDF22DRAFT_28940 [Syncephalis plumigaleata]|nr:hypothetical protein BDF22DRAFT_28940 [Syncephalis plumigaleata]